MEQYVSMVGGVGHNLPFSLQGCRAVQVLENGRLQPITFSAVRMIPCSLPLSLPVAAANQMVEEVRMD